MGSFAMGLLTGLREGIGPALTVTIILAYLARTGNGRHFDTIWFATGAAIALSVGIGAALWITIGGFTGAGEDIFEGVAMLAAATLLTWMVLWMRRTAKVNGESGSRVDAALVAGSGFGLAILAFTAVIREGIETAVFLLDTATVAGQDAGAFNTLAGAMAGMAIAIGTGLAVYGWARAIDRRTFFTWIGVTLIFIAAGLLSHAVREFVEAGWVTVGTSTAFDISAVLPHRAGEGEGLAWAVGPILRAVFGYSSRPEWITFVTWLGYLLVLLALYLRPRWPAQADALRPGGRGRFGSTTSSQDLGRATGL
jgi:high-affinity iron transporter